MTQTRSQQLIDALLKGDRLALARVISRIEDRDEDLAETIGALFPHTGKAHVIGITGPPGAGKSTLVDQLTREYRSAGKKVGIICVDPSSPFTGGAILGDRIRMQAHTADSGVFIRSLGTRGKHGGLSLSTKEVVLALDAAGFDVVIVETAGVGQTELDVLKLAQSIVVVLVPESGDGIQAMKAGLMEIADLFVVNKSDRPQSDQLVRELITMVGLGERTPGGWEIPVLKTQANTGIGLPELHLAIDQHRAHLESSGAQQFRARRFLTSELEEIFVEQTLRALRTKLAGAEAQQILDEVTARKLDPYLAAKKLSKIPD